MSLNWRCDGGDDLDACMSAEQPFYAPNRVSTRRREPLPREHLWAIRLGDHQFDCELFDHGGHGVEVQVLPDLEWFYGHPYETRAGARRSRGTGSTCARAAS